VCSRKRRRSEALRKVVKAIGYSIMESGQGFNTRLGYARPLGSGREKRCREGIRVSRPDATDPCPPLHENIGA
jgi:hypothetical protein